MATGIGQYGFGGKNYRYADAGKYFTYTNPTPGTGLITGVVTTLADTTPYIVIKNNNTVASGVKLALDFLRLYVSVVGVTFSGNRFAAFKLDASQSTTRYTSGGTQITPQNTNSDSATVSQAQVYVGAITAAAAGSARLISSYELCSAIEVVGDSWVWDFGAVGHGEKTGLVDNSTTITHCLFGAPPISIGPQEHFLMHIWGATMATGITFGCTGGYVEV